MKNTLIATLLGLAFLTNLATADTVKIPKKKPVISVTIPHSWKPEETEKGYGCESPDQVATVFLEVTSEKGLESLIDENVDWLTKEQDVKIDASSKQTKDVEIGGRKWSRISWDGKSKEWGASIVGFLFSDVGSGKILTITYWITKKDQEKHLETLEGIFSSVKLVSEK